MYLQYGTYLYKQTVPFSPIQADMMEGDTERERNKYFNIHYGKEIGEWYL
jgi:hypothetical protein